MTYDQYWYGDPLMVRAFYKADQIRQSRLNDFAWLQGAYVCRALQATVGNMMKKKTDTPIEYPTKPLELDQNRKTETVKTPQQEEQEKAFARLYMMQMMQAGQEWGKH